MRRAFILLNMFLMTSLSFANNLPLACPEFPFFEPKTGPLAITNCDFHHSYENRVNAIQKTFGAVHGRPLIMNLAGTLILKYNGKTESMSITPPAYHQIKSYSHITFTIYLLLSQNSPGNLTAATLTELQKLQSDTDAVQSMLPTLKLTPEANTTLAKLMDLTHVFLNKIIAERSWSYQELIDFYQRIKPFNEQAIRLSVQMELQTLDQAINKWLAMMGPDEIKKLGIVVATAHQPRAQEISLQYFAKRFQLRFGEGALYETALVVLEGQYDEKAAISLLARHYLDREAAQVIFNDPEKLQRDLLADAAKVILEK